jgi:hypothetical protein
MSLRNHREAVAAVAKHWALLTGQEEAARKVDLALHAAISTAADDTA